MEPNNAVKDPNINYSNFKRKFGDFPREYSSSLPKKELIEIINYDFIRLNFCGSDFDDGETMTEENCHYLSSVSKEDLASELVDEFFPCEVLIKAASNLNSKREH